MMSLGNVCCLGNGENEPVTLEPANSVFENQTGLIDQYSCAMFNHCCVCACVCVQQAR